MANFEVFCWIISSSIKLLFLKSEHYIQKILPLFRFTLIHMSLNGSGLIELKQGLSGELSVLKISAQVSNSIEVDGIIWSENLIGQFLPLSIVQDFTKSSKLEMTSRSGFIQSLDGSLS